MIDIKVCTSLLSLIYFLTTAMTSKLRFQEGLAFIIAQHKVYNFKWA